MAYTYYNLFKVMLIAMKYVMGPFGIFIGNYSLTGLGSGAPGFTFFGILTLSIGVTLLILLCVDCATADKAEEVFLCESICCGLPLYFMLVALSIFAVSVSSHGTGKSLPGIEYKEYELRSYSKWLQHKVNDTYRWETYYKPRLVFKYNVCSDMINYYNLDTLDTFHQRLLNAFESSCCKPPEECKMNYTSPTVWTKADNKYYSNVDCYTWSNDPNTFCINCQSCKAAFAQDVKHRWVLPNVIIVIAFAKPVTRL